MFLERASGRWNRPTSMSDLSVSLNPAENPNLPFRSQLWYAVHTCSIYAKLCNCQMTIFLLILLPNSLLGALHRVAEISLKRSQKSSTISYYMYTNPQSISTVLPQGTIVGKQEPELACYAVINICSWFTIWEAVEETTITNASSFLQLHSLPVLEVSCTLTINPQHWYCHGRMMMKEKIAAAQNKVRKIITHQNLAPADEALLAHLQFALVQRPCPCHVVSATCAYRVRHKSRLASRPHYHSQWSYEFSCHTALLASIQLLWGRSWSQGCMCMHSHQRYLHSGHDALEWFSGAFAAFLYT